MKNMRTKTGRISEHQPPTEKEGEAYERGYKAGVAEATKEIKFPSEEERIKEQGEYLTNKEERTYCAGQKWVMGWIKQNISK